MKKVLATVLALVMAIGAVQRELGRKSGKCK